MLTIPVPLALGRFKRLPQRTTEVWQGGIFKLPAWIENPDDPDTPPIRPSAALWTSLRTGLVHLELAKDQPATPELAFDVLLEFGLRYPDEAGRPARVEVTDTALAEFLSRSLAGAGVGVEVVDDVPEARAVLREIARDALGKDLPSYLDAPGVTLDDVRALAEAAAAFYRARVWEKLVNADLVEVEMPEAPEGLRLLSVLGDGGELFGLGFFESRKQFEAILDGRSRPRRAAGVTFMPIDELPFGDVDLWEIHGLPVEGPEAYPLACEIDRGEMRRFDVARLRHVTHLLRAFADVTDDELDAGRWSRRIETPGGTVDMRLALPLLLEEEAGTRRPALVPTARMAERASVRVARLLEGQSFESLDEVNAAIARAQEEGLFEKDAEQAAGRPLTPLERAQELAYDAMETTGRLRIKRARQALAISADCADAWLILAEAAPTAEAAMELCQRGVEAGARAIGEARLAEQAGRLWDTHDTRPYLRARMQLAVRLRGLGRSDEAIDHWRELLRLDADDHQGVRYLLAVTLLEQGRDADLRGLFDQFGEDDIQAIWPYARALWLFRTLGDTRESSAALRRAIGANGHAIRLLAGAAALPRTRPPYYGLGSREEGAFVADMLFDAVDRTPGALEWLRRHVPAARASGRRRRRARSRKR